MRRWKYTLLAISCLTLASCDHSPKRAVYCSGVVYSADNIVVSDASVFVVSDPSVFDNLTHLTSTSVGSARTNDVGEFTVTFEMVRGTYFIIATKGRCLGFETIGPDDSSTETTVGEFMYIRMVCPGQ